MESKRLEQARDAPASLYRGPEDVLSDPQLSEAEKPDVLRRWEYDALEEDAAANEGMRGEQGQLLDQLALALARLSSAPGAEAGADIAPTARRRPTTRRRRGPARLQFPDEDHADHTQG